MEKAELKQRCIDAINLKSDMIQELGDDIYKNPELGYKEFYTTGKMEEAFRTLGIEPETGIAYTGCRIGTPKNGGPNIAVIGELDCVMCAEHPDSVKSGNVHACGHNVQLANLFGCAVGLIESKVIDELGGSVTFIAIPAEECVDFEYRDSLVKQGKIQYYGGKQEYLRRGGFDDIDMVLQCHMMEMPDEKKHCFIDTDCNGFVSKIVTFKGTASHAGFAPSDGVNALNMAELAINNIHALRETFRDENKVRVSTIITEGGTLVNVVPSSVTMQIMVRAFTVEAMLDASRKVNRALKAGALAIGGQVEIKDQIGYLPLRTDRNLSALYRKNMMEYGQADDDAFIEHYEMAGSTDLGDLSQMKPCMHIWAEGVKGGLHTKDYCVSDREKAYIAPAKMLALTVIDLLYGQAEEAERVIREYQPSFTKEEYLNFLKNHSKVDFFDASEL